MNVERMNNGVSIDGYVWEDASHHKAHGYILPAVERLLSESALEVEERRLFDLGCGNGSTAARLTSCGWSVVGVDPSRQGIERGKAAYPELQLFFGSAYEDLSSEYGQFPVVISLEVVEHVYAPRDYAATLFDLVEPGGIAIVSTPYHGYFKNLALAVSGKMDSHFTALWDHGHIKFWSEKTLRQLLTESGFSSVSFLKVGRVAPLAKSMIAVARKIG